MGFENSINDIIKNYGSSLWLGFVSLVVTTFILTVAKNFVADLVLYFKAKMSDIGYGQRIYYKDQIYIVQNIHFKYIVIYDDKKIIRIPIKTYMEGTIEFPQPRYDDFDENKYHQKPWDGKTDRRNQEKVDNHSLLKKAEDVRKEKEMFEKNKSMSLEDILFVEDN